MKITVKIEDGAPVLFLLDAPANPGRVLCWARVGEHSEAARAYMRGLPSPATESEIKAAWSALRCYSTIVGNG